MIYTNDRQLYNEDIGQLENVEQLIHFFAQLGYDVDDAISLDHAALGMDSEDLRQQIRHIHRIASDPDEDIIIYFLHVRAVTVALTHTIARRFRERTEDTLLVLTKDFESLDFVLINKDRAKSKAHGKPFRQIIRPRSLTVNRRNPDPVALRTLKRFTYTEMYSDHQWDKLRATYDVAEWAEPEFNNRALFSDYYLKQRLTDERLTPQWKEDVRPIGRMLHQHLSTARQTYTKQPELTIRRGLYEPLFQALGFEFEIKKSGTSIAEEPDYLLYTPGERSQPVAVALTYVWNRNLDNEDFDRDPDTKDEIPGAMVVSVLENTEAPWVIVTNGKLWRLYSATASNKATNYYEVDLEEALAAPDQIIALKYWWLFFRHDAFTGFLDDLLQNSADYAKALGDRLKDRVFTQIFPHFAAGFIHYSRVAATSLSRSSRPDRGILAAPTMDIVYQGTLTFLYRLMFVLYAESLELLPLYETRGYREQSLYKLKGELAERAGVILDEAPPKLRQHYTTTGTDLYDRLTALFTVIDTGSDALNLPTYNGGLFSKTNENGEFLADYKIPDRHLALGLDRLCRDVDDKTQALAFIDFKSLGVRHLGSIYEGLLEFKLHIAQEELAVIKNQIVAATSLSRSTPSVATKRGKDAAPTRGRVQATIAKGDVYLENDKKERKATGSYYTPDYIVKYIVENTVGPVLERKFEELRPRLREAQKLYRQHKEKVAARGNDQPAELFWNRSEMRQLADDCLNVRVLDPAMGSGHFLVEVVDFVSNRLINFLNSWSENPVWALLERTREDILQDMERQGVTIDVDKLTRVALLKRAVLKRCVYGVDLNLMAVELAKVSLWLDAFTLGAPLSFLDHHLKQGNSLIGARIEEARAAIEGTADSAVQLSLFSKSHFTGMKMAVDAMRQVSFLSDNTVAQVTESRSAYRSALDFLEPFKRVLDVYTSRWFGNTPKQTKSTTFDPAVQLLQLNEAETWLQNPQTPLPTTGGTDWQKVADIALDAAAEKCFFHWELEFPELFFAPSQPGGQDVQLQKDGGFDAVVGNPPYGSLSNDLNFLHSQLPTTSESSDIYVAFLESCTKFARNKEGYFGFIIPLTWQTGISYSRIRSHLVTNCTFNQIVNLPYDVFEDAYVDTGVFTASTQKCESDHEVQTINYPKNMKSQPKFLNHEYKSILQERWVTGRQIVVLDPLRLSLLQKVNSDDITNVSLKSISVSGRGILANSEDVAPKPLGKNWKPFFTGYMNRYEIENTNEFVLFGSNLRESPGSFDVFTGNRMLVRRLVNRQDRIMATFSDKTFVTKKDIYFFKLSQGEPYQIQYLAALMNSQLLSFVYLEQDVAATKDDFRQITLDGLRSLPIRRINFTSPKNERESLLQQITDTYTSGSKTKVFAQVLAALVADQSDVVHDVLTHLAQTMLDLNNQKQAEVKRFLGWLEGKLSITPKNGTDGIASLTGKSILQGYLGDYQKGEPEVSWEDFFYRLHQNRNRFQANLAQIKPQIEQEYEKSLAVLLPIKQQLAATDALIDQIVYKLYGLSDEEIELIERPAYEQALTEAKENVLKDKKLQKDPDAAAEAIAENILPAAKRLQSRVNISAEEARLTQDIPGWHLFTEDIRTFLLTGEYNIAHLPDHLDFSTSVIGYTKAVEQALVQRIFDPFRTAGFSASDCKNKVLQGFMAGSKKLTLGNFSFFFTSSEKALQQFIEQQYPGQSQALFFDKTGGIRALLNDQNNIDLRNRAAHQDVLTKEDARNGREWALSILRHL